MSMADEATEGKEEAYDISADATVVMQAVSSETSAGDDGSHKAVEADAPNARAASTPEAGSEKASSTQAQEKAPDAQEHKRKRVPQRKRASGRKRERENRGKEDRHRTAAATDLDAEPVSKPDTTEPSDGTTMADTPARPKVRDRSKARTKAKSKGKDKGTKTTAKTQRKQPTADKPDPKGGNVDAKDRQPEPRSRGEEDKQKAGQRTSAQQGGNKQERRVPKRRVSRAVKWVLLVVAVSVAAVLLMYSRGMLGLSGNPSQQILGEWRVQDSAVTLVINESQIKLPGSVVYTYKLDEQNKTISFSVGNITGSAQYGFAKDASGNIIMTLMEESGGERKITRLVKLSDNTAASPRVTDISTPSPSESDSDPESGSGSSSEPG